MSMKPFGDIVILSFQDSNKYAGLITLPLLRKLLDEDNITLSATLTGLPETPRKKTPRKETSGMQPNEATVRIVVHGLKRDGFALGNSLSDADLYLQHPTAAECGRDLEYCNPHYLVRPGSQIPQLDQLAISSSTPDAISSGILSEVNKNQLMQVFDLACEDSISSLVVPSDRLSSTLKA